MGGLPSIRGLRIPVTTVIGPLAAGQTHEKILADFPELEDADIYAALVYAAAAVHACAPDNARQLSQPQSVRFRIAEPAILWIDFRGRSRDAQRSRCKGWSECM